MGHLGIIGMCFLLIVGSAYLWANSNEPVQPLKQRQIIDFNEHWLFEKDDWVGLHNASQFDWDDSHWIQRRLPHSWNADDTFDETPGYYRGFGWYRKHFKIDPVHQGRRLFLRFGAIYVNAEIWINEIHHFGPFSSGYTPIEIDITDCVQWENENLIAIRVNNIHNDEIPPGRWRMDYNCYGGIYREVELLSLSSVHLLEDELFVTTPRVSAEQAEISVQCKVKNESGQAQPVTVLCELFDGSRKVLTFSQEILVPPGLAVPFTKLHSSLKPVKLWSPEHPNLYRLHVSLILEGQSVDDLTTEIGFREFRFDAENGFFLNGQPLKLRGLNRHQCYPGLANAVPVRLQIEDARLLKELGANFVRCSHYPQHPAFLNACDRLGLLVYEEIASWQHIGGNVFVENANQTLAEMIRRDRNHPSIILWGLMNEGRSVELFERLQATAKQLDPTRPTGYAENHLKEAVELGTAFMPDVLGLNYRLEAYDAFHQAYPHLKLVNTECTNPDFSVLGNLEQEIKAVLRIKQDLDFIESRSFLAGLCIWSMHDYGTEYKPVRPIQKSGVVDVYRRFKEGAYYLKSRWSKEPLVHITGHWTWPGDEGKIKAVYVWSNCNRVKLLLNGREIRRQSSAENFWQVPYQPGQLVAEGFKRDKKVSHILQTAGLPRKIVVTPLATQLRNDGFDAVPVFAQIVDANDQLVPLNNRTIVFEIIGSGRLIGIGNSYQVSTCNGTAAIVVQAASKAGKIVVRGSGEGLEAGESELMVGP